MANNNNSTKKRSKKNDMMSTSNMCCMILMVILIIVLVKSIRDEKKRNRNNEGFAYVNEGGYYKHSEGGMKGQDEDLPSSPVFKPEDLPNFSKPVAIETRKDLEDAIYNYLWKDKEKIIKKYGHISDWDTSQITNMEGLFDKELKFNEDISRWNTSKVTDMSYLFNHAHSFNNGGKPLKWDTSNVENMDWMFYGAKSFNQNISNWDVSNVTSNKRIFIDCPIYERNKPIFYYKKNFSY